MPVIRLRAGDQLQSLGDGTKQDGIIKVVANKLYQPQGLTYNLTVDIGHTFYVGKLRTWVHNTGNCYTCSNGTCAIHQSPGTSGAGTGAAFADQTKLDDHFIRHGGDFGASTSIEYQAQADIFLTGVKPANVLEKTRANGDIVRYDPATDEFGVVSSSGVIRTYYKPDPVVHGKGTNLDYFNAQ